MKKRCSAINRSGIRCRTWALKGEELCIWHSDSDKAQKSKNKPFRIKTKQEYQLILQREVNRIIKKKPGALRRANEVRQLVSAIFQIGDDKKPLVDDGNQKEEDSFEKKIARAKKRKHG